MPRRRRRARTPSRRSPTCGQGGSPPSRASPPAPRRSPARARSPAVSRSLRRAGDGRDEPRPVERRIDRGMRRGCPALPEPSVRNTAAVATGTPGFASTAKSGGRRKARTQHLPGPGHHAGARSKADRHVGAGVPRRRQDRRIVEREAVEAGEEPQRRGGVGRAAAEAGRDRQALRQMEGAGAQARDAPRERAGRLEHEVVGLGAGGVRGRAGDGQAQRARLKAQVVAGAGEGDEAFERVIAVRRGGRARGASG